MTSWSAMIEPKKALLVTASSLATSVVLARTFINKFIVTPSNNSNDADVLTVVIDEYNNEVHEAATSYLSGKVSPSARRLQAVKQELDRPILVTVNGNAEYTEVFNGVEYRWQSAPGSIELTFDRRHREEALGTYLPHVMDTWKAVKDGERQVQLNLLNLEWWNPAALEHPVTFDSIAMEPEVKKAVKDDLERFVRRRDYYRQVGKAWKRAYLLYGPPETGKSNLVIAMADFLKFDVYKLPLKEVSYMSSLQTVLMITSNRSILVVEDTDGSEDAGTEASEEESNDERVTLSRALSMIDGFMSTCWDERVIVVTTNHRERLDPAILRPGRMDLHIHMSYCTPTGFRALAENYLGVKNHRLFPEIERLIGEEVDVTPEEVTDELVKSEEAEEALQILLRFLTEETDDPKRRKNKRGVE